MSKNCGWDDGYAIKNVPVILVFWFSGLQHFDSSVGDFTFWVRMGGMGNWMGT